MIKQPAEMANQNDMKIRILIAGFPGIGKSTLGLSAPKPLHIDVDRGISRVKAQHRKPFIQPEDYEELLSDLKPENIADFDSLVFDTGGKLLDFMKPWAIKQNQQNGQRDGTLSLKGYGAVGREFQRLMDYCFYELKKNVVVLFHAKEEKEGDYIKLRILVEGQTKDNVWQPMELGGFMEMQGNKRTIGFTNCEKYFAKGTHGIKGILEVPDAETQNTFLSDLFAKVNENIRSEAAVFAIEREKYDKIVAKYKPMIDGIIDADAANDTIPKMKSIQHSLTSERELKTLFSNKVKALNLVYDKEGKKYVPHNTDSTEQLELLRT
jgi:hypothetical protein